MSQLSELLNNQILFWSLLSCLFAQLLKIVFNFFLEGELRVGIIFETGGMPSSHSALITGLTAGTGMELGFDNPLFALAVGISLIIMYDASGIRKAAGGHAEEINKLSKNLQNNESLNLKEKLGHTKIEVMVGSILGPLITLPGMFFIGSPQSFLNFLLS